MRRLSAVLLALFCAAPALAQGQNACYDRVEGSYPANTYFNAVLTDQWRASQLAAEPATMAAVAGVWYGEQYAPNLGMVNHQYRSFEPNGLFQYQDETCGSVPGLPCSRNYGTGEWTARANPDGSVAIMMHFSDLVRTEACAGFNAMLDAMTMRAQDGSVWQRVPR